jgi:hypothetical protein
LIPFTAESLATCSIVIVSFLPKIHNAVTAAFDFEYFDKTRGLTASLYETTERPLQVWRQKYQSALDALKGIIATTQRAGGRRRPSPDVNFDVVWRELELNGNDNMVTAKMRDIFEELDQSLWSTVKNALEKEDGMELKDWLSISSDSGVKFAENVASFKVSNY